MLQRRNAEERRALVECLDALVRADRRINLYEYTLTRLVADHLDEHAGRRPRVRFHRLAAVHGDCRLLLSLLLHAGVLRGTEAEEVFHRTANGLLLADTGLLPRDDCRLDRLNHALERLQALTPLLKSPVVDACAFAVTVDNKIQAQAELPRVICTLLDCPMPPLFDSIP